MATISIASRLLYYDVSGQELKEIIKLAQFLFGKFMIVKVSGVYADKEGKQTVLKETSVNLDMLFHPEFILQKYIPVDLGHSTKLLAIPTNTKILLIESKL